MSKVKTEAANKCLTAACGGDRKARGLCGACYTAFRQALKRGAIRERLAVKLGVVLPNVRRGRQAGTSKFMQGVRAITDNGHKE